MLIECGAHEELIQHIILDVSVMQEAIQAAFLAGRWEWPELEHPTLEDFTCHVQRLNPNVSALERHGAELYLALACGRRDDNAIRRLVHTYRPNLNVHLERSGFDASAQPDALQQLLLHLCAGEHPRILTYACKASLLGWLKVAALRFAINMKPRAPVAESDACIFASSRLVAESANPEMRLTIEAAKPMFQAAVARAMSRLTDRDTTILRLFFVEGISNEGIGKLYGVHRATSARWIADIRRRIIEDIHGVLVSDFGMNSSEFNSLAPLIRSELNLSFKRGFGAA